MTKLLRVLHYPQVPCKAFVVEVSSIEEAFLVYNTLGNYDFFLEKNNHRNDYSNATFIEEFDREEKEWLSWQDELTGLDDIVAYMNLKQYYCEHYMEKFGNDGHTLEDCDNSWNINKGSITNEDDIDDIIEKLNHKE